MICERYETLVIPFPFAERRVLKRRPVVAISGPVFNQENGHTLVAMITTAKATSWPTDMPVRDIAAAGLRVQCVVRMRFTSLPNGLILRRLGSLAPLDRLGVEKRLAMLLLD